MAASSRHICRALTQAIRLRPAKRKRCPPCPFPSCRLQSRQFSSSFIWRVEQDKSGKITRMQSAPQEIRSGPDTVDLNDIDPSDLLQPSEPLTVKDLSPKERATYETMSKPEQESYLAIANHYKALIDSPETDRELDQLSRQVAKEVEREEPIDFPNPTKLRNNEVGYWADDEDDEFGRVEDADDDFKEEHMTSIAENELELHREIREYARIAAWDMPLLSKYAKEFEPPASTSPLRFRYTTYMGEVHPSQNKVVVQFCTRDLPDLTESQRIKLLKLAGVRYNLATDVVKMSCEKFENPAQNKRYLGDLIEKLLHEAKDEADMFADVPIDTRHVKKVGTGKGLRFPEDWKMTSQRARTILELRGAESSLPFADGEDVFEAAGAEEDLEREYARLPKSEFKQPKLTDGQRQVSIPATLAGAVIGLRSSRIKEIQKKSGATVSVAKPEFDEGLRMCTITGTAAANEKVLAWLYESLGPESDLIQEHSRNSGADVGGDEQWKIGIPNRLVFPITGRGGSRLNEIRQSSGARVEIARNELPRVATIVGSADANEKALGLIHESMEAAKLHLQHV